MANGFHNSNYTISFYVVIMNSRITIVSLSLLLV